MATTTFEDRTRFNWGYHDAAAAVRNGYRNCGFAVGGTLGNVTGPEDVLRRHSDRAYALGWQQGFFDATDGFYEGDSSAAWDRCVVTGEVEPQTA